MMRIILPKHARRGVSQAALLGAGLLLLSLASTHFPAWLSSAPRPALAQQSTPACPPGQSSGTTGAIDADPQLVQITFTDTCGNPVALGVDLAADPQSQEQGLMNVTNLRADQGELFIFNDLAGGNEIQVGFWMKDTPLPLSVAFIGKDGTVHEIQDMNPETTTLHTPQSPYLYAVETNQGWFSAHNIAPGSKVDLTAALALVSGSAPS